MDRNSLVRRPAEQFFSTGDYSTSGVPIVCVTTQDRFENNDIDEEIDSVLPLPASKYRYSKWCELENAEITSDMLKSPRIRKAPSGFKVDTIWMLEEQERAALDNELLENYQNRSRKKRWGRGKRKQYQNKLENWEQCELANLSYQDLGHPFQMKEFLKILRRLLRAGMIELIEDSLSDLSTVSFPKCKYLFLQRNHLANLKKLPKLGNIEHISLQQNDITSLNGLELLKNTGIKSLILRENPVSLQPDYRKRVFTILPGLIFLDDLPRLSNNSTSTSKDSPSSCSIF